MRASRKQVVLDLQVQTTGKEAPEAVTPRRGRFDLPRTPIVLSALAQVHRGQRFQVVADDEEPAKDERAKRAVREERHDDVGQPVDVRRNAEK